MLQAVYTKPSMNLGKIQKNKTAILALALAAALVAIYLASGPQKTVSTSTHVPAA